MNSRENQLKAFDRLLTIMDELREKCPWDKKQTMETLRHLTCLLYTSPSPRD